MNNLKNIIRGGIWTIVGLYVSLIVLLHIPAVQDLIGNKVGEVLSEKFGTKVTVDRVDLGFLNRLVIDGVYMQDQSGKTMLEATRMSVNIGLFYLMKGKIVITSAQLFGLNANLYKQDANTKPNFQFVLDSLASKDTTSHTPLDLSIGSLIVRHGRVKYDQLDVAPKHQEFALEHILLTDISAHVILNTLTDDSLNVNLKRLSFKEKAGLDVGALSFKLAANKQSASLENFLLKLPNTNLTLEPINTTFQMKDNQLDLSTLSISGGIEQSKITPSDISCFVPLLRNFKNPIYLKTSISGTQDLLNVKDIEISSEKGSINLNAYGS
ncbi:MAG: translocation/assembly module TamB, partial [Prevotella sp.]|nr:translocation/assembly module TamB [Prevotella sp.]